ncbi:MAG: hypothetical protein U5L11_06885 [Arhodomonas sp.]|nr:hypothetical protein [Arhodomonas sp.]
MERFGNPYTASVHDLSGDIGMEWGVYGVPETFILDADGRIDYKHIGAISQQDLNEETPARIRRLREGGRHEVVAVGRSAGLGDGGRGRGHGMSSRARNSGRSTRS